MYFLLCLLLISQSFEGWNALHLPTLPWPSIAHTLQIQLGLFLSLLVVGKPEPNGSERMASRATLQSPVRRHGHFRQVFPVLEGLFPIAEKLPGNADLTPELAADGE